MTRSKSILLTTLAIVGSLVAAACSDSTGLNPSGIGTLMVRLTDAPFLSDSVQSVDIYVVRVDARQAGTDDAGANSNLDDNASANDGWKTVATPNASINLLSLQNGVAATLGQASLAAGTYNGFRLIIDPSKSSITLKGGQVLNGGTTPGVTFPSASRSGIKIVVTDPVQITGGTTTALLVDFNVNDSFVMRGNSITQNGLLFKPVIKATVTNLALTSANVRLANATDNALNFNQNNTALAGGSNLAFGTASSCAWVNATTPNLSVTQLPSTTLPLALTLAAGKSFTIVAFPGASGIQFSTLANAFTPAAGQTGLIVFNGNTGGNAVDVFVTAPGAPLGSPTIANVLVGASSAFVGVPSGSQEIRVTRTGTTTPMLLDVTSNLPAVQNTALVFAQPANGQGRGFLVPSC
jgi:Domain of unknown function (DUF4382)